MMINIISLRHEQKHSKKIPLYSLPEEWNKHNDMRYQNNKTTFKWALRAQLFDEIE
jgi:hypothetical protein